MKILSILEKPISLRNSLYIFFIFALSSCHHTRRAPGLCLSFDDRSIKEWYAMKELLHQYGASVTFFVTQFDSLSAEEIEMLKDLQKDGHEIASHGALHVQAERYIKEHSYKDYLANEIDASIASMNKNGFNPTSFAYPFGSKYWLTDFFLLKRFKLTRGVSVIPKKKELADVDEVFYSFDGNKKISAIEIDYQSRVTEKMVITAIERANQKKEVLILSGHEPSDHNKFYSFDPNFLKFILEKAKLHNLKFYRASDLSLD